MEHLKLLKVLDFDANDRDSVSKLVKVVANFVDKNVLILLLDVDTSMLNAKKKPFLVSIAPRDEKIIYNFDTKTKTVHILAEPGSLKELLTVSQSLNGHLLTLIVNVCIDLRQVIMYVTLFLHMTNTQIQLN